MGLPACEQMASPVASQYVHRSVLRASWQNNYLWPMNRIEKLQSFLHNSPQDNFLRHALALEYSKIGDETAARLLFEAILQSSPDYIGSYYHLAKLLERTGEKELAIHWYEQGMAAAKAAKDQHAYNELQGAYEDLVY